MTSIGRYSLEARIAMGGMAEVHLARLEGPGGFSKKYVIKTMLPHLTEDPQFIEMFLSEARLAALLNHPNVVQIFDFGEDRRRFYIAMEYVEGATLRGLLSLAKKSQQRLPPMMIAHAIAQTCAGLAYVHDLRDEKGKPLGLLHRDISPDNIIVSTDGVAKLLDFGIAKAANSSGPKTTAGTMKGKLAYMSPEQVRGLPLDRRADVYSLGVTLYELLAKRRPLMAENELELALSVLERTPPPLSEVAPHVPAALASVVERAMHRDLGQRIQSARALQAELEALTGSDPEKPVGDLREWTAKAVELRPHRVPTLDPNTAVEPSQQTTLAINQRPAPKTRVLVPVAALLLLVAAGVGVFAVGRRVGAATPNDPPPPTAPVVPPPARAEPEAAASEPAPGTVVAAVPVPVPVPVPVLEEPRAARSARAPAGDGMLSIRSNPWCHVTLDKESIGTTPLLDFKVRAGKHQLLLTNDKLGARRALTINVAPGKTVEQAIVFSLGRVKVDAPAGTRVFRGSELLTTAPSAEIELVAGTQVLGFILPDAKVLQTRNVAVKAGQTAVLAVP